ncbi:urocanate hydratase [Niabella soli DSM 19437]|uniref:Urocanate hydratase n=2 Tax=Niabella TaxID=379899 RepID=W0EX58_9BACT|nr:urocanate hydratase [Niabella soli DSM 19437]
MTFQEEILQGIPDVLPAKKAPDSGLSHAPVRKAVLNKEERQLAVRNALRYFPETWHKVLAQEFMEELHTYGRIYMYRFMPDHKIYARPVDAYPAKTRQAAAIMLMIQNNLDAAIAQHPQELITYGGNGAVFQNWAQYRLTMQYLATMTEEQTLHMYSGHPMGLFPSSTAAPRVVVTNGMMIPNYSRPDDWERYNALGVTQYGQMTAGSYMYIGPQGIVHGTTITLMNAFRKKLKTGETPEAKVFLTSGLGGMSGAQPKAGTITKCITVCAEINPLAAKKRQQQGWVDELIAELDQLCARTKKAIEQKEIVSLAYIGNVVDVWERFYEEKIFVTVGSDQTSLHNPWSGGYYPAGISFDTANKMLAADPEQFKQKVKESLVRHVNAINRHTALGTYFFDYGNAFLLEAGRAGAAVFAANKTDFIYPSYVQDILGPICFDYGFGPFRWVCTSGLEADLYRTDAMALEVLSEMRRTAPDEIQQQLSDNIHWIREAAKNKLVVGSMARILYADAEGRIRIAKQFNDAVREGRLTSPVVIGRDHHDVSGTDSPWRETSNIYDGSRFTADMAVHNVIGDSFRGATWVSIHNGGGVGWGEVINGGFGLVLDGSTDAEQKLANMLFYDVNNGIARRAWARNKEALQALNRELQRTPGLRVTQAHLVDDAIITEIE